MACNHRARPGDPHRRPLKSSGGPRFAAWDHNFSTTDEEALCERIAVNGQLPGLPFDGRECCHDSCHAQRHRMFTMPLRSKFVPEPGGIQGYETVFKGTRRKCATSGYEGQIRIPAGVFGKLALVARHFFGTSASESPSPVESRVASEPRRQRGALRRPCHAIRHRSPPIVARPSTITSPAAMRAPAPLR